MDLEPKQRCLNKYKGAYVHRHVLSNSHAVPVLNPELLLGTETPYLCLTP